MTTPAPPEPVLDKTDEYKQKYRELVNSITDVRVIIHELTADSDVWEIDIAGRTLKIKAENFESPKTWRTQYFKIFKYPLFGIKDKDWYGLREYIASKATHIQTDEITQRSNTANEIWDAIQGLDKVDDTKEAREDAVTDDIPRLIRMQEGYAITSGHLKELAETQLKLKFMPEQVSTDLHELG